MIESGGVIKSGGKAYEDNGWVTLLGSGGVVCTASTVWRFLGSICSKQLIRWSELTDVLAYSVLIQLFVNGTKQHQPFVFRPKMFSDFSIPYNSRLDFNDLLEFAKRDELTTVLTIYGSMPALAMKARILSKASVRL